MQTKEARAVLQNASEKMKLFVARNKKKGGLIFSPFLHEHGRETILGRRAAEEKDMFKDALRYQRA